MGVGREIAWETWRCQFTLLATRGNEVPVRDEEWHCEVCKKAVRLK
jgi:hypothetical protein